MKKIIYLNSKILRCEGKQKKATELLNDHSSFKSYNIIFEEDKDNRLYAHNAVGVPSGQTYSGKPIIVSISEKANSYLLENHQKINEACSCDKTQTN